MLHRRVCIPATGKKTLQGVSGNASIAELPGRATGRGEAFDRIAARLCALTNARQRRRLPSACEALQALYPVVRSEYLFDHCTLGLIELRARVGERDCLLHRHELRSAALAVL